MENNYSEDQKKFIEIFKRGENIFLTGKAGTGKSFITQVAMEIADKEQMTYIAVAPTGIAAFNIGGQTMHSMFNLSINGVIKFDDCNFMNAKKRKVLQKAKVIFIDEVSMLRPDHLDAINWTLIKNGIEELTNKQIVFIGDLKQLPPPIDDNMKSMLLKSYDGYCFKDSYIYKKLNVQEIDLGQVLRQSDPTFIDNLNIIRNGGKSEYFRQFVGDDPGDGIILAPHNSTVQEYNKKGLNKIDSEEFVFKAEIDGKAKAYDFNLEETIVLKDGCQIMYLVNSKGNPLYNGSIGTYRRIDDKDFIEIDGEKWLIEEVIFKRKEYVFDEKSGEMNLEEVGSIRQIPVKLAYALTIHKAQGLTFEKVTVDLTKNCFAKGQLYTALSRVTGPEGLTIKIKK